MVGEYCDRFKVDSISPEEGRLELYASSTTLRLGQFCYGFCDTVVGFDCAAFACVVE